MNKKLILITISTFILRICYHLITPLLWDEAALGYNTFSILKTGKDEYGQFLPLIFKSFGDYKPGLYVYLTVPFVFLFGLNELSVRLPSIILGSLTPLVFYYLITTIDPKKNKLALLSALILSITPFHIHFSRGAWETNIFTFEIVLAIYFFYKYLIRNNSIYLFFSSLIFGLSLYTYQSAKLISLLIICLLFLLNLKSLKAQLSKLIFFILPLILFTLPILFGILFHQDSSRLHVLSIFSYPRSSEEKQMITSYSTPARFSLFNGNIQFLSRTILSRYFNHFSPQFLFFQGDWQNSRHSTIYTGVLLLPSLLFLPLGLISFKLKSKTNLFFLLWLLITPIASALTRDSVSAVRSALMVIPLSYFTALGIITFFNKFKKFPSIFIIVSYAVCFYYYSDLYYKHNLLTNPDKFLYGYKQAINYINQNKINYQSIRLSDSFNQPYIFYLFYSHYPPSIYQSQALLTQDNFDTGKITKIDNVYFGDIEINQCLNDSSLLCIISQAEKDKFQNDLDNFQSRLIPLSPINNISTFYAISH